MALFSLKRIAGEAENRQTYLRGVACYNAGKVGRVVRDRDDFYEEYLSADVENNTRDGVFHVEVGFGRQGDADFYDCGCEAYRQGTGACQHIVAVMVHKYYADMLTGLSAPPSAREKMAPMWLPRLRWVISRPWRRISQARVRGSVASMGWVNP